MRKLHLVLLCCLPLFSLAQNEVDALRYSWTGYGGSARYMGLGGAMGAVGGDMSCSGVNPAGMARFTKSELGFTLSFTDANANSVLYNNSTNERKGHFFLGSIGLVGAIIQEESSDWKTIQLGFTYNRYNHYTQKFSATGNSQSTLLDVLAGDAKGIPEGSLLDERPYSSGLAYWAYLIDPLDTVQHTYSHQIPGGNVWQSREVVRDGSMGEMDFFLSANYVDKLYFGLTIGLPTVRFYEDYTHSEQVLDTSLALDNFSYTSSLITRGMGINAKFGVIFLPVTWVRLGIALHTPSGISLSDQYSNTISSEFRNGQTYTEASDLGTYNYHLKTPGRTIFSAAVVVKQWGLISADYELVNYTLANLRSQTLDPEPYPFTNENKAIRDVYHKAGNLRLGGELRYHEYSIRGGYSLYGSPFADGKTLSESVKTTISFGAGYRNRKVYLDATCMINKWTEDYYLYDPTISDPAVISNRNLTFIVSGGLRF